MSDLSLQNSSDALVSVVIPTRNRASLIARTLDTVYLQTYPNIEILVVIDGPDADTVSVLDRYPRRDQRLRVFPLPASVGACEARNFGIEQARGLFIAMLDDDDEWLPQKIAAQLDYVRQNGLTNFILSCQYLVRHDHSQTICPKYLPLPAQRLDEYILCPQKGVFSGFGQTSTLFFPRQLALDFPFEKGLKRGQDLAWMLQAFHRGNAPAYVVPQLLSYYNCDSFTDAQQMGKQPRWESLLLWTELHRDYFSPRSYAYCLLVQLLMDATTSGASLSDRLHIIALALRHGRPDLMCLATVLYRTLIPIALRQKIRSLRRL